MDATRFTYIGRPGHAGALAQELKTRGLAVHYQPPVETKDFGSSMALVAVVFAVTGPLKDIVAGVRAFTTRFAGTRVEGLPDNDGSSVQGRLARLDELKADGTITEDEHAKQRAHIIGEL
jgi:hypothetical protein